MRRHPPFFFLLASFFLLAPVLAPAPARAGHPFATDDAGTLGARVIELELVSSALGWLGAPLALEPAFGVAMHVGLGDAADLGIGFGYELSRREDGEWSPAMTDPAIDLKWRLVDPQGARPGFAVRLDYAAPQRFGAVSSGHAVGGLLIASWQTGPFAAHLDLGAHAQSLAGVDPFVSLSGALAVVAEAAPGLFVGAEGYVDGSPNAPPHAASALAALIWQPSASVAASFGAGGLWDAQQSYGFLVTFGLTASFGGGAASEAR